MAHKVPAFSFFAQVQRDLHSLQIRCPRAQFQARSFNSTPVSKASVVKKASAASKAAKQQGIKKGGTFRLKKGQRVRDGRPPAAGERRALRKRVIISNTNALPVAGLKELNPANMSAYDDIEGKVLAIPGPIQDKLRAVEAFKIGQGWSFFRTPASLMREETVQIAGWMDQIATSGGAKGGTKQDSVIRRILTGERRCGKSVLLLQAMTMGFLRNWVIISIPEARELTTARTEYGPIAKSDPVQYDLPTYTATLLGQMLKANEVIFKTLKATQSHGPQYGSKGGVTCATIASTGANEPALALSAFRALWSELTAPGRPPILCTADNISHFLAPTNFNIVDAEDNLSKIHPYDFALIKHFIDLLSGETKLPNGGMVLAATSESEHAKSHPLEVAVAMAKARQSAAAEAKQALPAPDLSTSGSAKLPTSPPKGSENQDLAQFWSPYKALDMRILSPLTTVDVLDLKGFSKDEARAIIEYWAGSGMVRSKVDDRLVQEKWTISGGGVIGEMEKAVVRGQF